LNSVAASAIALPPFQQLLDSQGRDVHRFLVAMVGRIDAEDCYQETWIAALRAYPRLRDAANLRGWIFTVAHRKALDHLRSRRRTPIPVEAVPEPAAPTEAARLEPGGDIWALVGRLPAKQRTAVALRFLTDSAYAEIAAVMGVSEEAARRNVHEGLKRLRTEYQP
jgi:RNA polymerase sigma factor (sigma-70 family)